MGEVAADKQREGASWGEMGGECEWARCREELKGGPGAFREESPEGGD